MASQNAPSKKPDLVTLFVQALRLAGKAGAPVAASRIAAKGWWYLSRQDDEAGANKVNGVMHYLARLPPEEEPAG